jgi:hypothetical protein
MSTLAAQEATPASPFADLGLPTLDINVTADAYEGIPESVEAGRYLVTVSVAEDAGEFGGGVGFIQPTGLTGDEFIAPRTSGRVWGRARGRDTDRRWSRDSSR